jgi:hypothetical protein
MNKLTLLIALGLVLFSCGEPQKEEGEILEYDGEEITEESMDYYMEEEEEEGDFEGIESKHVLFCQIGMYQDAALMVLDWKDRDENGIHPITGYYFYVKNQKNLDLEGYSEPSTRGIYLTESWKGKETGYMEFAQDDWDGENFWAPSKESTDRQEFNSQDLIFTDPMDANIALQYDMFTDEHGITIYMGEEEGEVEEMVTDELNWVIVNEEFFAFDISVTGRNAHTGAANGLANIQGDKAIWIAPDDDQGCKLTFDLSNREKEISVTEDNCTYYHGFHASFDATFRK